jgi:hypothetical protein
MTGSASDSPAREALFALRIGDVYGDPSPWTAQARAGFTALSALNVTKHEDWKSHVGWLGTRQPLAPRSVIALSPPSLRHDRAAMGRPHRAFATVFAGDTELASLRPCAN